MRWQKFKEHCNKVRGSQSLWLECLVFGQCRITLATWQGRSRTLFTVGHGNCRTGNSLAGNSWQRSSCSRKTAECIFADQRSAGRDFPWTCSPFLCCFSNWCCYSNIGNRCHRTLWHLAAAQVVEVACNADGHPSIHCLLCGHDKTTKGWKVCGSCNEMCGCYTNSTGQRSLEAAPCLQIKYCINTLRYFLNGSIHSLHRDVEVQLYQLCSIEQWVKKH